MTTYKFSDSLSLANTFAVKLQSGLLNIRTDYESADCPTLDVSHTTMCFSTDIIEHVRIKLHDYKLSKLEATNIVNNPDSLWREGEIRHVAIFAKDRHGEEVRIATFDVERDYLDGDTVEGWTRWTVTNVLVQLGENEVKLISERIDRNDYEVIWGRVVQP